MFINLQFTAKLVWVQLRLTKLRIFPYCTPLRNCMKILTKRKASKSQWFGYCKSERRKLGCLVKVFRVTWILRVKLESLNNTWVVKYSISSKNRVGMEIFIYELIKITNKITLCTLIMARSCIIWSKYHVLPKITECYRWMWEKSF